MDGMALIMKGGGIKGLAYVGALEVLEEYYNFDWFAGTSAGAVTAILLAAGFTTEELKEILANKNFNDFKDAGKIKRFWNIITKNGLFEANTFTKWVDSLLSKKLDSPISVRLEDLPKRATVYASQEGLNALVFDSKNPQTKVVRASYAARCSMSIPWIFTPQENQGINVFDGGVQNNYPVELILEENRQLKFIGLYLGPKFYEGQKKKGVLKSLTSIWTESVDVEALRRYKDETIIIDTRPVSTLNFKLSELQKDFLINTGRLAAIEFLDKKKLLDKKKYNYQNLLKEVNSQRETLLKKKKNKKALRTSKVLSMILILAAGIFFSLKYYPKKIPDVNQETKLLFDIQDKKLVNDKEALNVVIKIISNISGLRPNFSLEERINSNNVWAAMIDGERIIFYDPLFFNEVKTKYNSYWPAIFITSHEMSHHLNGHTTKERLANKHEAELDCDYFGGFILARLGAPLDEMTKALEFLPVKESPSHPSRKKRTESATKGWLNGQK